MKIAAIALLCASVLIDACILEGCGDAKGTAAGGQGNQVDVDGATPGDDSATPPSAMAQDSGDASAQGEGEAASDDASPPLPADAACGTVGGGTMCGPPDRPCRLGVNEVIAPALPVGSGLGGTSLAIGSDGVHLLFSVLSPPDASIANTTLLYAHRGNGSGSWSTELTPITSDYGAVFLAADGVPRVIVSPTGNPTIYSRVGGSWQQGSTIFPPGPAKGYWGAGWPWSVAVDAAGNLHALVSTLQYVRWSGQFSMPQAIAAGAQEEATTALSASGSPQFAFWGRGGLTWSDASGTSEVLPSTATNPSPGAPYPIGLAVTQGAVEQPAVLFPQTVSAGTPQEAVELTYAQRDAPSAWTLTPAATGDASEFAPATASNSGPYQYTTYRPISVLTDDSGAVRIVYAEYDVVGVIGCEGAGGGFSCFGTPTSIAAKIHVGWFCGSTLSDAVVASDLHPSGIGKDAFSPAVRTADGAIHVAVMESGMAGGASTGRYFVLTR